MENKDTNNSYNIKVEEYQIVNGKSVKVSSSESKPSNSSSSKKSGSGEQAPIRVDYNGIISDVNNMILNMKGTNFLSSNARYVPSESNSSVFTSIDKGESYLFNISNNMLYQMSQGANQITTMLNNYATQDAALADLAGKLANDVKASGCDNFNPTLVDTVSHQKSFSSICEFNQGLFIEDKKEGTVGKITNADLNGLLAKKNATLDAEIEDSAKLTASLDGVIKSPNLNSPGWESFKNVLNRYRYCNEIRGTAAETLKAAYNKAVKMITDFIGEDESLDDKEIPQYEKTVNDLQRELDNLYQFIADLYKENARLRLVPPKAIMGYDEKGKEVVYGYDYTPVLEAQRQIEDNLRAIKNAEMQIKVIIPLLKEAKRYLKKLRDLSGVVNEANKIVNRALNLIENMYAKYVYNTTTPRLQNLANTGMSFTPSSYGTGPDDETTIWTVTLGDGLLPELVMSAGLQDPTNPKYADISPNVEHKGKLDPLVDSPYDLFGDSLFGVNGGRFRGAVYSGGEWYYTKGMEEEFVNNGAQTLYMTVDGKLGVINNVENGKWVAGDKINEMHPPVAWATSAWSQFYGDKGNGEYGLDIPKCGLSSGEVSSQGDALPRTFITQAENGDISISITLGRGYKMPDYTDANGVVHTDNGEGMSYSQMADFVSSELSTENNPTVFGYNLDGGGSTVMKYTETNEKGEVVDTKFYNQYTTGAATDFPAARDENGKLITVEESGTYLRQISNGLVVR